MRPDLQFWVGLNHYHRFGPRAMKKLIAYFSNLELAWSASAQELMQSGITQNAAEGFVSWRETINLTKIMEEIAQAEIKLLTIDNPEYPNLLKNIYDPPALIYYQGAWPEQSRLHVAIVGSRLATDYGLSATKRFGAALAKAGAVIVSGLAYGIDEAAHLCAVEAKTPTIAVLASGLAAVSGRHRHLMNRIVETGGLVISEFPPHAPSLKTNFPIRNRIVSGLCRATLVVEAAARSGSLITAHAAMDQGRDVFSVPGPITSLTSEGANRLIREGATLVHSPEDLIEDLKIASSPSPSINGGVAMLPLPMSYRPALSSEEERVASALSTTPIHIDDLIRQVGNQPAQVLQMLGLLELQGLARHLAGNYYIIA